MLYRVSYQTVIVLYGLSEGTGFTVNPNNEAFTNLPGLNAIK